ncbi:MAG: STAS domain-containing protein [Candidatus Riflebacteria bacterium]|nr:STAS domain-containing protein [Candidatus Riflebacteria bacterium]
MNKYLKTALKIEIASESEDEAVIKITGNLSEDGIPVCEEYLAIEKLGRFNKVTLNLSQMDFISSAGISVLMKLLKAMSAENKTLILLDPQPQILKIFKLTRLDRAFQIVESSIK